MTETIALRGASVDVLVPGHAVGHTLTVLEYTAPPRFTGGPLHRHAATVEVFRGVAGVLTLRLMDEDVALRVGDTVAVPPGVVHAFRNDTPEAAVFLVVAAPSGLEDFLRELAPLLAASGTGPPPDPAAIAELERRYDQLR